MAINAMRVWMSFVVFGIMVPNLASAQGVVTESSPYARTSTERGFQVKTGAVLENDGSLNIVVNPGFERMSYGWQALGGVFRYIQDAGRASRGVRLGEFDPTAGGQVLRSEWAVVPSGIKGTPGVAYCETKTAAGDYLIRVLGESSGVLAEEVVAASSEWKKQRLMLTFPATDEKVAIAIVSGSNASGIDVDQCFIGEPTPILTSAFSGSAIPDTDDAYDLGSPSASWKDLWLKGDANIGGALTLPGIGGPGVLKTDASGDVGSSDIVDGDVSASAAIARSKLAPGDPGVVINDAFGELTDVAVLPVGLGGTGVDTIPNSGEVLISDGSDFVPTALNTDNVPEGSSNEYFTDAKARSALSATSPVAYNSSTGVVSLPQASGSQSGYLSSADFASFSNKANPGNYITALTGEVSASGPGSASATLSGAAVVGKLLSGLDTSAGGTVISSDSILSALGKIEHRLAINDAKISGFQDPMTTDGDLIIRSGGVTTRLPLGADGQVLTNYGGQPTWRNNPAGFENPMNALGDIIYSEDAVGTAARLEIGSEHDVLTVSAGGIPEWAPLDAAYRDLSNLNNVAVNTHLLPDTNNAHDLGSGTFGWRNIWLTGSATFSFLGEGVVISDTNGDISSETYLDRTRGGTGISSTATFPSSGTVAVVPAAGFVTSDGTSLGSQADIDLTTDVDGVLPVANGGTGLSSAATDGQLLIGNGTGFSLSTITGTANRVSVTNGAGSITLSGPQDIHTGASPTFAGATIGTLSGVVKATSGVLSAGSVDLSAEVTGTLPVANGGTGLTSLGAANTLLGVNSAGTAGEYKALSTGTTGTDFAIAHGSETVTLNLPDASPTARGVITTGDQEISGNKVIGGLSLLEADVPTAGDIVNFDSEGVNLLVFTGTAPVLKGLSSGADGRIIVGQNKSGGVLQVVNNSGDAAAGDKILTGTGDNIEIEDDGSFILVYSSENIWSVVGGTGSGSGKKVYGSQGSPQEIDGSGIVLVGNNSDQDVYIAGDGGSVTTDSISPGVRDGQILTLIGTSDTNSVVLELDSILLKDTTREIGLNNILTLRWNGSAWVETNWSN